MSLRLTKALRTCAIGLLALGGAEIGLRASGQFDPTELPDPYLGFPGSPPIYRLEDSPDGPIYRTSPTWLTKYREQEFTPGKIEDELRIFVLGGSSVVSERFQNPDAGFPRLLQLYLVGMCRKLKPNVINAGGAGTGSVQNLEVAREVIEYGADILVLYPEGGEKNLIPPAPGGVLAHGDHENPQRALARKFLARTHVYCAMRTAFASILPHSGSQWVRSAFSGLLQQALAEPFSEQTFTRMFEMKRDRRPVLMPRVISAEEVDFANARFVRNLREVARLCREKGVELVLVNPLHNMQSSFYLRFHIDPEELLPGSEQAWIDRYESGLALKRAGKYARALVELQSVRELYRDDADDILCFYLAECHAALGDAQEELRELMKIYKRHPMLEQIAQVAKEEDVLLVDPFPALVVAAEGRAPGWDFFIDSYHPTPATCRIIARSIAVALGKRHGLEHYYPVKSEPFNAAENQVELVVSKHRMPTNWYVREAIEQGRYADAVRIARAIPEEKLLSSPVDPYYLGWAFTRAGRLDEAKRLYEKLKVLFGEPAGSLPDMSEDSELIRHAFQGDVFAIF